MKTLRTTASCIMLAILTFTSCQNKAEKAELDKFKAAAQVQEQNKKLVQECFAAIDKLDFNKLDTILANDFSYGSPELQKPLKKDELFGLLKSLFVSFPDWTHGITDMTAEGDKVVVKLTCKGTHKETYMNIPATGKAITQEAICIVKVVNGKVKESWIVEDFLGLFTQLGMELKPKEVKK
jgi:steroid delta-isomerase-like uncharacterized protein